MVVGENVARGSLLGALVGARVGLASFPPHLRDKLFLAQEYAQEAEKFVEAFAA